MQMMWQQRYLALGLLLASTVDAHSAAPLDELKSVSALPAIDLQRLKQGDIVTARGGIGSFARGVYAESAYFIHAPAAVVGNTLLHWDPTKHRDPDVAAFREYRWPASADVFAALTLSGSRAEDRWLIDRTWDLTNKGEPTELHLTVAEIEATRGTLAQRSAPSAEQRAAAASEVWRKVLQARSESVATGGLSAVPNYTGSGGQISAKSDLQDLLQMAPAIASRFGTLMAMKPLFGNGAAADETVAYWEASQVRGHTGLHSGVLLARKGAGSWQLIDLTYYTSDTYFISATLYEIWPVDDGSLVWQIDFVSAPFHSLTNSIERVFAGREMLKESTRSIQSLRAYIQK